MIGVSILAITLVPALIPLFIRGRLRSEEDSWLVRSVIEIYRPVLRYLIDHPWPIVLVTALVFIVGFARRLHPIFLLVLAAAWSPASGRHMSITGSHALVRADRCSAACSSWHSSPTRA